jgi:hypothetical protein
MKGDVMRFLLLAFLIFSDSVAWAHADKKVTLIIYLDFSLSMNNHRNKVAGLVPYMAERLQRECGNYQIATSNILYRDSHFNNLTPYGNPTFISPETPRAEERVVHRIMAPFQGDTLEMINLDGYYEIVSGTKEVTYSSVAVSIEENRELLADQDLVAALLVTDAAPAYELGTAEEMLQRIHSALPQTQFMAGAVAMKMYNGMPRSLGPNCRPDIPYSPQNSSDTINTSSWPTGDLSALDRFVRLSGGWVWDICEDDYQAHFQEFIQTVVLNAGCQLLM